MKAPLSTNQELLLCLLCHVTVCCSLSSLPNPSVVPLFPQLSSLSFPRFGQLETPILTGRLFYSRQGFGRGGNNKNNNTNKMNNGSPAQSPAAQAAHGGHVSNSPSLASNHSAVENTVVHEQDASKYFFQEKYAPLNVKGNFLTLCACPKNVELGEWLAHQSKRPRSPRRDSG
jgi:hypothetical protein